jgi:hypothetical protein
MIIIPSLLLHVYLYSALLTGCFHCSYLPWVVAYLLESTLYNNKNNNTCVTALKCFFKGNYIIDDNHSKSLIIYTDY